MSTALERRRERVEERINRWSKFSDESVERTDTSLDTPWKETVTEVRDDSLCCDDRR